MKNLALQLGQNIKKYRKAQNLKQSELAEMTGIEAKYLSRLETGLSTPSFKMIEKIAEVLKVDASVLFEYEQDNNKEELACKLKSKIENYSANQLKLLLALTKFIDKTAASD